MTPKHARHYEAFLHVSDLALAMNQWLGHSGRSIGQGGYLMEVSAEKVNLHMGSSMHKPPSTVTAAHLLYRATTRREENGLQWIEEPRLLVSPFLCVDAVFMGICRGQHGSGRAVPISAIGGRRSYIHVNETCRTFYPTIRNKSEPR